MKSDLQHNVGGFFCRSFNSYLHSSKICVMRRGSTNVFVSCVIRTITSMTHDEWRQDAKKTYLCHACHAFSNIFIFRSQNFCNASGKLLYNYTILIYIIFNYRFITVFLSRYKKITTVPILVKKVHDTHDTFAFLSSGDATYLVSCDISRP